MRTGGYTIQQTLTTESASVLKLSLTLARRRGHAQVTPLHVAATLLSSRTSLLRRACIKSHPGFQTNYQFATPQHHLQCRALELCFNVALNRLPTIPSPMFHGQPSLANALVAALKRAQAHQRRDCIEQQQTQTQTQTQLLVVKVEIEQLVISILDDPSVSRVMREAGFNSTAVKSCVEDCSVSSVFSAAGVFSSPNSPESHKGYNFIRPNFTLWKTHFSNQNPLLVSSSHHHQSMRETVVDVLLRKKKNPVIVGDSVSFIEGFVTEFISKLDETEDLKQTHVVKFQFSPIASKFMRREDVEMNIKELKKQVVYLKSSGKNVIIFTGDLKWTVKDISNNEISSSYNPLDHLVEEMRKLIAEHNDRVWVMGTASFQTYMRCQMRQPSLETLWSLYPISAPSSSSYANLGLSLHATSGNETRNMSDVNATKLFLGYSKAKEAEEEETISSVLSCCPECVSSFEREAKSLKANQDKKLPSWLQSHHGDSSSSHKELMKLRSKWNRFCENGHRERTNNSSSMSLKANQRGTNSIAKFRRQDSSAIEFELGRNEYEKSESITLDLGSSLFRSDSVTETRKKIDALAKALEESVPWHNATMRLLAECLMDCLSKKKDGWIMIEGNDVAAKRNIARIVSETVFGSFESLVRIDLNDATSLAYGLENREKVVFLIEGIDLADSRFSKLLAARFEKNRNVKTGSDNREAIFILTKEDSGYVKNRDSVLKIGLEVTEQRKRKPESDLSVKEGKNRKKEVFSSFTSSYLDLNIKAEDEGEGEVSPISSDLTGEEETEFASNEFLNRIQNRFVLNRLSEPGIEKAMLMSAFMEVFPEGGNEVRFSVEEKLLEEFCGRGYGGNEAFGNWLKEVFQKGLLTVKNGGKKDKSVIRMVFGGIVDKGYGGGGGVGGYKGTCLPNKVQVVSKFE